MSRTLKVTAYHITYDRGAWFLRVIMSSSCICLACRKWKSKNMTSIFLFRSMYNKTIVLLDSVFVISRIFKVLVTVISHSLHLWMITPTLYLDLDYSGYHKNFQKHSTSSLFFISVNFWSELLFFNLSFIAIGKLKKKEVGHRVCSQS